MGDRKTWYLKCSPEDCAPSVVLVGDPTRVHLFAKELSGTRVVAQEREFTTLTGRYQGLPVSVISIGIGAPAAAIAMEELWELGARVVVRAGTVMALNVALGDFVLAQGAVRFEGISTTYLPLEFPALADADLFFAFRQVLDEVQVRYHAGLVATSDGFYTQLFHHALPNRKPRRDDATLIERLIEQGVLGADMETSAIYTIGQFLGIKCVSLCVATVDGRTQTIMEPALRAEKEKQLVRLVLKGLYAFSQRSEGRDKRISTQDSG